MKRYDIRFCMQTDNEIEAVGIQLLLLNEGQRFKLFAAGEVFSARTHELPFRTSRVISL